MLGKKNLSPPNVLIGGPEFASSRFPIKAFGNDRVAQSMIEYILLVGIVTIVLIYMGTDFKRGLQSVVKTTADQMGTQANSDQDFNSTAGFLVNSITNASQSHGQLVKEYVGTITTQTGDYTQVLTNTVTKAGQ